MKDTGWSVREPITGGGGGGGGLVPGVTAADGSVRMEHAPTCQCSIRGVALTYSQLQQENSHLVTVKTTAGASFRTPVDTVSTC